MTLLVPAIDRIDADLVRNAVVFMAALILSISVHEFGHARVADYLGDSLPRSQGRVTLNPIRHIDLWGTILFPLIMFVSSASGVPLRLLGWGKPVQVSTGLRSYRHGISRRTGQLLIALAGPSTNVVFGLLLSALFVLSLRLHLAPVAEVLASFVVMNIGLAIFNLLPCPPLDGGAIVAWVAGPKHPVTRFLEKYGFIVFFALFFTGLLAILMAPAVALGHSWLAQLSRWAQ